MSQNPFDALGGGGGFDINALFEQAQAMQEQLVSAQEKLAESTVEGTVAGGAVTVRLSGTGQLEGVDIKTGQFDGSDADDLADLSDMIVAAYRDAKAQADALAGQSLGPLAGGMGGGQLGDQLGGLGGLLGAPAAEGGAGDADSDSPREHGGDNGGDNGDDAGEPGTSPRGFGF